MSDQALTTWTLLSERFAAEEDGVSHGKMMSADALTHGGKVFAFFSTKGGMTGLGCRLGRDFDVESLGLSQWKHLAPFKTKPPMKDWIVIGEADRDRWEDVMSAALAVAKSRKK